MHDRTETAHRPLCTIELIAKGHATRCPGDACAFWDHGCVLSRIEIELEGRPEVAELLVGLRRELEAGREIEIEETRTALAELLNEDDNLDEPL